MPQCVVCHKWYDESLMKKRTSGYKCREHVGQASTHRQACGHYTKSKGGIACVVCGIENCSDCVLQRASGYKCRYGTCIGTASGVRDQVKKMTEVEAMNSWNDEGRFL